jgi:hypothetical protein
VVDFPHTVPLNKTKIQPGKNNQAIPILKSNHLRALYVAVVIIGRGEPSSLWFHISTQKSIAILLGFLQIGMRINLAALSLLFLHLKGPAWGYHQFTIDY